MINYKIKTKRFKLSVIIIKLVVYLATFIVVGVLFGMLSYIIIRGLPAINWQLLSTVPSFLKQTYGILPMIINTIYIVIMSLIVAIPLGVGSAIFLSEYAKQNKFVGLIRYTIEILSGIPSIVYGLFGSLLFVNAFKMGYSIKAGAFTLAIIVLPIIIRTTEESLKAIDSTYREAAISMGVSKIYIIRTILLPCALPGILTAIILSIGRMVGESAALLATSGTAYEMPRKLLSHMNNSGATLTVQLYQSFTERPAGMSDETPFAISAILIILVLLLNFMATVFAGFLKKKG
jgi:phosphate transport system permease protein